MRVTGGGQSGNGKSNKANELASMLVKSGNAVQFDSHAAFTKLGRAEAMSLE